MMSFRNSIFLTFLQRILFFAFMFGLSFAIPPFSNNATNLVPVENNLFTSKPAANPVSSNGLSTENIFSSIVTALNGQPWVDPPVFPSVTSAFTLRCKPWPEIVQNFTNSFVQNIKAEENLKKYFVLDNVSGDQVAELFRSNLYKIHTHFGTPETPFFTQLIYHAGKNNYDRLTTESYIQLVGNFVGKYLFLRGLLTPDNVENFSRQYFEEMKNSILHFSTLNPAQQLNVEGKIRALIAGVIHFLAPRGLYTQDSVWALAALFANEWDNL